MKILKEIWIKCFNFSGNPRVMLGGVAIYRNMKEENT